MTRTIAAILLAFGLLIATPLTALGATGTTVRIEHKALLGASPFFGSSLIVVVAVDGTGGCFVNVQVSQTAVTGTAFGSGGRSFTGTGQREEIAVTVTSFGGAFNVGQAQALAQVFCYAGPDADTATINIVAN